MQVPLSPLPDILGSEGHMAIRCDYCQHVCHIAHAAFCDPENPSNGYICCLDHLIYHREALKLDLGNANVHLSEDPERIIALTYALSRRLSAIPFVAAPLLARPFPIVEVVDDFILQKSKRKSKTARNLDSGISDSHSQLQSEPCPILPPSFQHQPFLTALRINHLREFRIAGPDFFEGSSSIDKMQESIQREDDDADALFHKRDRGQRRIEESIDQCRICADCSSMYRNIGITSPRRISLSKGEKAPEILANSPQRARGELLSKKRKEWTESSGVASPRLRIMRSSLENL